MAFRKASRQSLFGKLFACKVLTTNLEEAESLQAGYLLQHGTAVLNSVPCIITDTQKFPGKIRVIGSDVFTGKKHNETFDVTEAVQVPKIRKSDFHLEFMDGEKLMRLMPFTENPEPRDWKLSVDDDKAPLIEDLYEKVTYEDQSLVVIVTILSCMGQEKICAARLAVLSWLQRH
jgi:translation initiation factor 5A